MKKLYKSRTDKQVEGICGGLGEYFNVDSTLIRLAWVIFGCCGGAGIFAYLVCSLIVPAEPKNDVITDTE